MKTFIILAAIAISVYAISNEEIEKKWAKFKIDFDRKYDSPQEEQKRLAIFGDNLRHIEKHNALYIAGEVSYGEGITPFADWTDEEFSRFLGPPKSYDDIKPEGEELHEAPKPVKTPNGSPK